MSETPRLSRRELRELGKLDAPPADEPLLTETAELRLGRPSRRDLREAAERERAEMEARQAARAGDISDDVSPSPDEVPSADEPPTVEMSAEPSTAGDSSADVADGDVVESSEEATADVHQRKSVFDRFEDESENVESPAEDDGVAPTPEHSDMETADEIDGDENVPLRDRFLAMTKKDEPGEDVNAETEAITAPTAEAPGEESESPHAAHSDEEAEGEATDSYADTEVESPNRRWLIPLLIIVLGLLVGYLAGSWINKNYLSESVPYVATEIVNLLL